MQSNPELRLILVALPACNISTCKQPNGLGIQVRNCHGPWHPRQLPTFAVLMLGADLRASNPIARAVKDGEWQRQQPFCLLDLPDRRLSGKTLGILGFANWGRRFADWPRAFGMRVICRLLPGRPHPGSAGILAELVAQVDILISLHCADRAGRANMIMPRHLGPDEPGSLL